MTLSRAISGTSGFRSAGTSMHFGKAQLATCRPIRWCSLASSLVSDAGDNMTLTLLLLAVIVIAVLLFMNYLVLRDIRLAPEAAAMGATLTSG
jgi:hypothetical protein